MAERGITFSGPMVRRLINGSKTKTRRLIKGGVPEAPSGDVRSGSIARHATPYLNAYCGAQRTALNPRGMSPLWCWWTRDDRMGREFTVGQVPGDRFWVKEIHAVTRYTLDYETGGEEDHFAWVPDIDGDPRAALNGSARFGHCAALHYAANGEDANPCGFYPVRSISDHRVILREAELSWRSPRHMWRWASRLTGTVRDVKVERLHAIDDADALSEGVVALRDGSFAPTDLGLVRGKDGLFDIYDEDLPPHVAPTPRAAFALLWEGLHGRGAWDANPYVAALTFDIQVGNIDAAAPVEAAHAA